MEPTFDQLAQVFSQNIYLSFIIVMLILWIKYEENLKRLCSWLKYDLFNRDKMEMEKRKNSFSLRSELFMNRISSKIMKVEALQLSKDIGRNTFYHFLVRTLLTVFRDGFDQDLKAYLSNQITKEQFTSYHLYHRKRIEGYRTIYINLIKKKLKEENWAEPDINYVISIFYQWSFAHFELLAELISSSKIPEEVVMSWWVFFYEFYTSLEKFSLLINGRITGKPFDGLTLGKPSKHIQGDF